MSETSERPSAKAMIAVLEDEINLAKRQGEYLQFQRRFIERVEKEKPGLGRWLQESIDKASSDEEAESLFETAYIYYNARDIIYGPRPPDLD